MLMLRNIHGTPFVFFDFFFNVNLTAALLDLPV